MVLECFPSNSISSITLVSILSLIIGATWWNFDHWFPPSVNLSSTSNKNKNNKRNKNKKFNTGPDMSYMDISYK